VICRPPDSASKPAENYLANTMIEEINHEKHRANSMRRNSAPILFRSADSFIADTSSAAADVAS
jgi:hypothetical protein